MTKPNILIFMVDQAERGRLFPVVPPLADAPNLKKTRHTLPPGRQLLTTAVAPLAPGRASFMSGLLPSHTRGL